MDGKPLDNKNNKKCVVVIPAYKKSFDSDEEKCVKKYEEVLNGEELFFIVPETLDKSYYKTVFPNIGFVDFPDKYFKGITGYNKLMLSIDFYLMLSKYEYVLIAQPDAVIFRKENMLDYFISKGFDYYGAPWIPERRIWEWVRVKNKSGKGSHISCAKKESQGLYMGNGGFSLRNISQCIKLIKEHSWRKIYWYIKRNEDIFFGLLGREGCNRCNFALADVETGKEFALEYNIKESVEAGCIPFGVHGWSKYFDSYESMEEYLISKGVW